MHLKPVNSAKAVKKKELQNFIQSGIESALEILESGYPSDMMEHTILHLIYIINILLKSLRYG